MKKNTSQFYRTFTAWKYHEKEHLTMSRYFHEIYLWFSCVGKCKYLKNHMDRVKRIWYLSPMRAAKVQASLRIRAVSPEPSLLAHTSSESSGTFRQKARSLDPLNGWACAVEICHDRMLEDTNSLDGAHMRLNKFENKHAVNKEVYLRTRTIAQSPVHKIQEFLNAPTNVDILKVCKPT